MNRQQNLFVETRLERSRRTESGEVALERAGQEESCALALSCRVWAQG